MLKKLVIICTIVALSGCQQESTRNPQASQELLVAAAANLTDVFAELGPRFTDKTGIRVVFSFGATADLAKQIENGAPFDVFAAADTEHVNALESAGLLAPGTRSVYARGRLVVWLPPGSSFKLDHIEDISAKPFERIAIAKPDVAPYGQAAVEALKKLGIWNEIEPRVVYSQNVSQAKQYAATGNAEAAFIPLSLVKPGEGSYLEIQENLHQPIDQALGVIKSSAKQEAARQFAQFLLSTEGQEIFVRRGYAKQGSE